MWFNPIMIWLLKSPLHGFVSGSMILLTLTGRKSGKTITTPTNYLRDGNTLWIVSWRERTWWRNLRGGAKVQVLLKGKTIKARGEVIEETSQVAQSLADYYRKTPQVAKYVGIKLDESGKPILEDCLRAAQKMVMAKIEMN